MRSQTIMHKRRVLVAQHPSISVVRTSLASCFCLSDFGKRCVYAVTFLHLRIMISHASKWRSWAWTACAGVQKASDPCIKQHDSQRWLRLAITNSVSEERLFCMHFYHGSRVRPSPPSPHLD